jgi:hypothetical protein
VQGVQVIEGDITLRFLEGLTSLNGLGSLQATNGEILLHKLPRLTSTRALTNLTSIGEYNNTKFSNFAGQLCRRVHSRTVLHCRTLAISRNCRA